MSIVKHMKRAFYKTCSKHAPVQSNKIIFENIGGKGFGENPRYIAEEIHRRGLKVKMYWLVSDIDTALPTYIRKVQADTLRAEFEISTAGYIISNIRRNWKLPKKKRQIYLQTWHGGYPMKKIERDAEATLPQHYIQRAQTDGKYCDAITANDVWDEQIFQKSFWLNEQCQILKTGTPRCDILLNPDSFSEIRTKVCEVSGVNSNAFMVLYAPTFRNNGSMEGYIKDLHAVHAAFEQRFGETVLLVRLHPNMEKLSDTFYSFTPGTIINVSHYPDPQELVIASDFLITDYSSIAFDFALIRKPVILITKDLIAYRADRDLYRIFDERPFPYAFSEEDLLALIKDFSHDNYQNALTKFYQQYPSYNTGNAAAKIVDWLVQHGLK